MLKRTLIQKTIYKTADKNHARRLKTILILHRGDTVSDITKTLCYARSSLGCWVNWFTLYGLEGLKSLPPALASLCWLGLAKSGTNTSYSGPTYRREKAVITEDLAQCSAEQPVFYEDEVAIHLNPQIGANWQLSGQ